MTLDRASLRGWAGALLIVALGIAAYHRTLAGLWGTWNTNDNYSHGPLVPLVSAALVFMRWRHLRALPISPYGIGKLSIEHYLHYFRIKHGLQSTALRISNPYGTRQKPNKKQGLIPIALRQIE